jgi:hypothetical protein
MQLDLLDSRTSVVLRESEIQRDCLESVSSRIAKHVLQFATTYCGLTFHSSQLHQFVAARVDRVSPGSADRILRDLKQRGLLSYTVVNRARSLYRMGV